MVTSECDGDAHPVCPFPDRSHAQSRASLASRNDTVHLDNEIARVSREKRNKLMDIKDTGWRDSIRQKIEAELSQRVREALDTPPLERQDRIRRNMLAYNESMSQVNQVNQVNKCLLADEGDPLKHRRLRSLKHKHYVRKIMSMSSNNTRLNFDLSDRLRCTNDDAYPLVFGLDDDGFNENSSRESFRKRVVSQVYSKTALLDAIKCGHFYDGSAITKDKDGSYLDFRGIVRSEDGPFWPPECTPMYAAPMFKWDTKQTHEPLWNLLKDDNLKTFDNQQTPYDGRWRGAPIVYDTEKSPANYTPAKVSETYCPCLGFESRFESGNLRQVRRVGQFEYELLLRTDLYTIRHTQWYFFRVHNTQPGVVYKFRILNLLKKDSLYNYGMRPLMYSMKNVKLENVGWIRTGHSISYSRNILHLHHPLLLRGIPYYELEWQMEFPHSNDIIYLAHCYPYTFTDLRMDLDFFLTDSYRAAYLKQEVLCETRAGNSCYLLTVTDPKTACEDEYKKVVMVTARVHPGETNASWMMRGFIDYITGPELSAQELRAHYTFKIVPMLNPDGVVVGNYRCSLAGRDLNRNYRRPRKDLFPTVWHTKGLVEMMNLKAEILLYCDLHGHSRKQNIFMYGNNTSETLTGQDVTQAIVNERVFPWLLAQRCFDKFSFRCCKFQISPCKEATGRVVMWRQLRIANSFTMEASFCGTTCAQETRHFNTCDLQRMGQTFGRVIHDYHKLLSNQTYKREVILDLTCHLTRQIMARRGLKTGGTTASGHHSAGDGVNIKGDVAAGRQLQEKLENEEDRARIQDTSSNKPDKRTPPRAHLNSEQSFRLPDIALATTRKSRSTEGMFDESGEEEPATSHDQVTKMIDSISEGTLESCMQLLHQLNISQTLSDSDSSDSDSESDAEIKVAGGKPRKKKKRKSKKNLKKQEKTKLTENVETKIEDQRPKTVTTTRPGPVIQPQVKSAMARQNSALFISKYEGRHNNGIPCFSEERSQERATRRVSDVQIENENESYTELYPGKIPVMSDEDYTRPVQTLAPSQYIMTGVATSHLLSRDTKLCRTGSLVMLPSKRLYQPASSESSDTEGSLRNPKYDHGRGLLKRPTEPINLYHHITQSPSLPTNHLISTLTTHPRSSLLIHRPTHCSPYNIPYTPSLIAGCGDVNNGDLNPLNGDLNPLNARSSNDVSLLCQPLNTSPSSKRLSDNHPNNNNEKDSSTCVFVENSHNNCADSVKTTPEQDSRDNSVKSCPVDHRDTESNSARGKMSSSKRRHQYFSCLSSKKNGCEIKSSRRGDSVRVATSEVPEPGRSDTRFTQCNGNSQMGNKSHSSVHSARGIVDCDSTQVSTLTQCTTISASESDRNLNFKCGSKEDRYPDMTTVLPPKNVDEINANEMERTSSMASDTSFICQKLYCSGHISQNCQYSEKTLGATDNSCIFSDKNLTEQKSLTDINIYNTLHMAQNRKFVHHKVQLECNDICDYDKGDGESRTENSLLLNIDPQNDPNTRALKTPNTNLALKSDDYQSNIAQNGRPTATRSSANGDINTDMPYNINSGKFMIHKQSKYAAKNSDTKQTTLPYLLHSNKDLSDQTFAPLSTVGQPINNALLSLRSDNYSIKNKGNKSLKRPDSLRNRRSNTDPCLIMAPRLCDNRKLKKEQTKSSKQSL